MKENITINIPFGMGHFCNSLYITQRLTRWYQNAFSTFVSRALSQDDFPSRRPDINSRRWPNLDYFIGTC